MRLFVAKCQSKQFCFEIRLQLRIISYLNVIRTRMKMVKINVVVVWIIVIWSERQARLAIVSGAVCAARYTLHSFTMAQKK